MSIRYAYINPTTANVYITGEESNKTFTELIRRALNVWPDAPAELKEFGDMVCEGHVLQDYKTQSQSMKKFTERLPPRIEGDLPRCEQCGGLGYHHRFSCPALKNINKPV